MAEKKQQDYNKFEKTRLLSARALELAEGDLPKVKVGKEKKGQVLSQDYVKLAEEELDKGLMDLDIHRD